MSSPEQGTTEGPGGVDTGAAARGPGPWVKLWSLYRLELVLFVTCFVVFAGFSGQRFLRQSEAPHFIYQAKAWLEGRLDLDPQLLPNLEDWACVREVGGEKVRCSGRPLPTDRWYVSFPPFPAVVMLPFVAVNGYQLNDTSFTVFLGALAVALFAYLLRRLTELGELERSRGERAALACVLAFGTLFFYCTLRGEVWFTAEVMGVLFTSLYLLFAVRARRPLLAGLFFSMATLTRTPLVFSGLFFVLEALVPEQGHRLEQLRRLLEKPVPALRKLGLFALGAAPLAVAAAAYNHVRFGKLGEFGHRFLFNNRVNADIDTYGLFHPVYLARNLEAAFLKLPELSSQAPSLRYDPHGLSLWLTLPLLAFLLVPDPKAHPGPRWKPLLGAALCLIPVAVALFVPAPVRARSFSPLFVLLLCAAPFFALALPRTNRRLTLPLWLTVAVCALPGLFYQNTGYMQFGFRFSLDYTPHLLVILALSSWPLRSRWVIAALVIGFVVNFWGAVAFSGYTEYVRRW